MVPNYYFADISSPSLQRWLLDRSKMELHFFFNEPVVLADISGISFSFSFGGIQYQINGFRAVRYASSNTEVIAGIVDGCTSWATVGSACSVFSKFNSTRVGSIYVSLLSSAFQDLALVPNMVSMVVKMVESAPGEGSLRNSSQYCQFSNCRCYLLLHLDCSSCPYNSYTSSNCTAGSDRICSSCSVCSTGYYTHSSCTAYTDTQCSGKNMTVLSYCCLGFICCVSVCDACPLGTYISTACTVSSNTKCSTCTRCNALQYEFTECSNGLDTVCGSCKVCIFKSTRQKIICQGGDWMWWARDNCCYDEAGVVVCIFSKLIFAYFCFAIVIIAWFLASLWRC